jgi:protein gp37
MGQNSPIEWTDHTWTLMVGCDAISPACANCYAALMVARLGAMGNEKYRGVAVRIGAKGKWTGKVNFSEADLVRPLTVRKPGRWFLTSMGDVAHEQLSDEQIAEAFGVMAVAGAMGAFLLVRGDGPAGDDEKVRRVRPAVRCGPHTFMVLTKRPDRLARLLSSTHFHELVTEAARRWAVGRLPADVIADGMATSQYWPLPNVFIGCTAEDQQHADLRRPYMDVISAAGWKTFVSYEPALGPVDWSGWEFLNQIISGGESGPKSRHSHPDWHRAARDFAAAHGIDYLFKQWGEWMPVDAGRADFSASRRVIRIVRRDGTGAESLGPGDAVMERVGKKAAGRYLDGCLHNGGISRL